LNIGEQILELREQRQISLDKLALGICSAESLRNIELGKETVSKLFMEIIFQRIGKSTDKLELILSEDVYEEDILKERYEELLERGEGKQAEAVLKQFMKTAQEDSNVYQMFYCRSMAYAAHRVDNNPEKAKNWMQKALDITMPGWQKTPLEKYWISTVEMENLLAYAKSQLLIGTEAEIIEAEKLLLDCQRFIDNRVTDEEEHAKIYAKCAHLLAELYIKREKKATAEYFAERAWMQLREYGISYYMEPLLKQLVYCTEDKATVPYKKYLNALIHIKQFVGEEGHFTDSIFKNCSQQTYYLDYELFREERIAQGYSQEKMIEGVYKNPESLSRAERGKVTMRDSKLIRLLRRLGIEKCRYNGFVVTDEYAILELKQEVDILISRNSYADAEKKIEELKTHLDLTIAENRRWITGYYITLGTIKEDISKEDLLEQAVDLLQETYRIRTNGVYRIPMDREATLINQIGILLCQLHREKEAVQLFFEVTNVMDKSKVQRKKRYRAYSTLRSNLAKWTQSEEMAEENLKFTLAYGKLRSLPMNYMTIACAMLDFPANREICREMIEDTYHLCDLVCDDANKQIARKFYQCKFEEDIPQN